MSRKKKSEEPKVWPQNVDPRSFSFIKAAEGLVTAGLWKETNRLVAHRFGDILFLSYSKPKTSLIKLKMAGKMWRVKEDQAAKMIVTGG